MENKMKHKKYGKFTILSQFSSFSDIFRNLRKRNLYFFKKEIRFFFQRIWRGWDDSETWNLDKEIDEFVYFRLKRYFKLTNMAPPFIVREGKDVQLTEKEWDLIKRKILYSLNQTRLNGKDPYCFNKNWKLIKEGRQLFDKFRGDFWY